MSDMFPRITVRDHDDQHALINLLDATIAFGMEEVLSRTVRETEMVSGPLRDEHMRATDAKLKFIEHLSGLADAVHEQHDRDLEGSVKAHLN